MKSTRLWRTAILVGLMGASLFSDSGPGLAINSLRSVGKEPTSAFQKQRQIGNRSRRLRRSRSGEKIATGYDGVAPVKEHGTIDSAANPLRGRGGTSPSILLKLLISQRDGMRSGSGAHVIIDALRAQNSPYLRRLAVLACQRPAGISGPIIKQLERVLPNLSLADQTLSFSQIVATYVTVFHVDAASNVLPPVDDRNYTDDVARLLSLVIRGRVQPCLGIPLVQELIDRPQPEYMILYEPVGELPSENN